MYNERIPYNSDKMDESILRERKYELDNECGMLSIELLKEIEERYYCVDEYSCPYCGSDCEPHNKYLICSSCGIKIEKM